MPKHPEDTPSEFHENPEDWTPDGRGLLYHVNP